MLSLNRFSKGLALSSLLLFLTASVTAPLSGCGGNSMSSNRVLQSIIVTPAVADAASSPEGRVQYAASGTFSRPPSPDTATFVAPYSGSWSVSNLNVATISPSGVAQCVRGASGTVTVMAIASANSAGPAQMSISVRGTAKLTCP